MQLSIGVTGHRDLVEQEWPALERRVQAFFDELEKHFPDLELELLSALAEGADRLVASVALERGIPIIAVLPMQQSEYESDFEAAESLEEFRLMLGRAQQVIELPNMAGKVQMDRDSQYAQLGVFISNHCQVLLALWDGRLSDALGGTAHVVLYHTTGLMEGYQGDLSPARLLADNENDLVFHIVCSRDRPDGRPIGGLSPLESAWFSSRENGKRTVDMPEAYRLQLQRMERFTRDWKDKQSIVRNRSSSLLNGKPDLPLPTGAEQTNHLFRAADGLAIHYQQRVNSSLRAIHLLAVMMGLVFLVYSEFDGPGYMVLTFLGLFFGGVAIHIIGGSREWHRKYLDYRALAEGLRVQFYWNLSGVVDTGSAGFAYDNFLQTQDVDLGWIRHVMRQASMSRARGQSPDPGWVPWVIAEWIGGPGKGRGQLSYYSRKQVHNTSRFRRTQMLGNLCLWAGITIAILLYLLGNEGDEEQRRILLVLMGVLPLVAGIWDAYAHKKAEKELIKQYGFMSRVFGKARKLLDESGDLQFQRQVLKALGQAALDEGAEWLLMHRERPLEHGRL
ncbi:MAG: hypothetical protein OEU52_05175 [Xanthomonadales bacterium]|nr:hypothetical protein [Xanthomonadales bacterium]